MSKWFWVLGLTLVLTVQGWCEGNNAEIIGKGQKVSAQDSRPVIIPKPQSATWQDGSLLLNKLIYPQPHYSDISSRIERATLALKQFLQPASPVEGSIPLYLGVVGYDSTVAKRCIAEKITVPHKAEAYALSVSSSGITVVGYDLPGLFHGIMTLRQMKQNNNPATLPYAKIQDYPALAYRGLHIFTGKNALQEQKALVDVMALHKMNNIILQLDYMEYKSHPEIWYEPMGQKQSEIKELLQYCKDRFIEVNPMINTPGHTEWIFRNGLHYDICEDPNPTKKAIPYALYVDNDSTYQFLFEIYDEVIDLFKPTYFHIGHDEPDLPKYVKFPCRSQGFTVRELLEMDIRKNAEYFKNKNIKIMIWGDTMLYPDEANDNFNAKTKEDAIQLRKMLKEIEAQPGSAKFLICDWHYSPAAPKDYKSIAIFKKEGFSVIVCTWYFRENIRSLIQQAMKDQAMGMLQTTWAGYNFSIEANTTCHDQFSAYLLAADYSWSGRKEKANNLGYDANKVFFDDFRTFKQGKQSLQLQ